MPKKIQIVSVMSELGAGTRGSSLGLQALQMASLKSNTRLFQKYPLKNVKTLNDKLFKKSTRKFAKRLDGIAEMYRNIEKAVSGVLGNHNFPVIISGDHSNAGGTIAGIKTAYPKKRLGVIWIDAHADLHSPYTSPSGNVHGMPLATALHEDNLKNQNNTPEDETVWHWNELKGSNQRVKPSDLFFVGVRDTEPPEDALMAQYGMPNISTGELRKNGVARVAQQAREHLKDCDMIYISFDVDSMDPEISQGTGTPVPGGLTEEEARELILHLLEDPRVGCFEVTEINPLLDTRNQMAEAALRVIEPVIEKINNHFS